MGLAITRDTALTKTHDDANGLLALLSTAQLIVASCSSCSENVFVL